MTYWNLGCFIILLNSIQNLYTTKDIVIKKWPGNTHEVEQDMCWRSQPWGSCGRRSLMETSCPTPSPSAGLRTVPCWVFNICGAGDSKASLDAVFQCLTALIGKKARFPWPSVSALGRGQPWLQGWWQCSSGSWESSPVLDVTLASFQLYFLPSTF